MRKECKHIVKDDLTSAYVDSLKAVVRNGHIFGLMTEVARPILDSATFNDELDLTGLNLDKVIHRRFETFSFVDGKTGARWIDNRIDELFKGLYQRAICKHDQLDFVQNALKEIRTTRRYTWCSNRLLCLTFDHADKHMSHLHLTMVPVPPCLTLLDFKPERERLHLIAVWRAQYFDTKAYGNLISLAIMLRNVCGDIGFQPGHVISIANKAILKNKKDGQSLVKLLETSSVQEPLNS